MKPKNALFSFLEKNKPRSILVLCHVNADVDAMASALALFFCLKKQYRVQIGVPDHANAQAQQLARRLNTRFKINPSLGKFDCLVLVDCSSLVRTASLAAHVESFKKPVLVIDHHQSSRDFLRAMRVIDPTARSTCSLVMQQLQGSGFLISKPAWMALSAGLVSDSADLSVANAKTLRALSECLSKTSLDVSEVKDLYSVPVERSEKIACLKSLHRLRVFEANGFLVAVSSSGFFESQIAMMLLSVGADAAFVCGVDKKTGVCRLSARATTRFVRESRIHLGRDVCIPLRVLFEGHGNGHAGAAFFSAAGIEPEPVLAAALKRLEDALKKRTPTVSFKEII